MLARRWSVTGGNWVGTREVGSPTLQGAGQRPAHSQRSMRLISASGCSFVEGHWRGTGRVTCSKLVGSARLLTVRSSNIPGVFPGLACCSYSACGCLLGHISGFVTWTCGAEPDEHATLHHTTPHHTTPHHTAPHRTALHCTALHCTALHCTAPRHDQRTKGHVAQELSGKSEKGGVHLDTRRRTMNARPQR